MKDKDKSSQKNSAGSNGARSAKRTGSGGDVREAARTFQPAGPHRSKLDFGLSSRVRGTPSAFQKPEFMCS